MREVILVCGPPCAGKTTYVQQHAQPGDRILDADELGEHAMQQALAEVAAMTEGRAWVIRCAPGEGTRAALRGQLGADRVVLLNPPTRELWGRTRARPRPGATWFAVRKWLDIERGKAEASAPRGHDPAPKGRTRW